MSDNQTKYEVQTITLPNLMGSYSMDREPTTVIPNVKGFVVNGEIYVPYAMYQEACSIAAMNDRTAVDLMRMNAAGCLPDKVYEVLRYLKGEAMHRP